MKVLDEMKMEAYFKMEEGDNENKVSLDFPNSRVIE